MYGEYIYMKSLLILYSKQNEGSNHYNWVVCDSVGAYTVFFMVLFILTVDVKNWSKEFPEKKWDLECQKASEHCLKIKYG